MINGNTDKKEFARTFAFVSLAKDMCVFFGCYVIQEARDYFLMFDC